MVGAALAAVAVCVAPGPAAAKTKPCWKVLINDWYDGRIDFEYPSHCYTDAIKHAPSDLQGYSDLESDLTRALQSAKVVHKGKNAVVAAGHAGRNLSTTKQDDDTSNERHQIVPAGGGGNNRPQGPAQRALQDIGRSGPDSIPAPLLALGALALVLVAAGAAGLARRRIQARRATP